MCHDRLNKKLVRVLLGFKLGLGVRDSVGGPVVVVRQALQPSFRCPMGADRTHTSPDVVPISSWCECAGNPDDNLNDVVETITKEGLVPLHL